MDNLTQFRVGNKYLPVIFRQVVQVRPGVLCFEYDFAGIATFDLGIIEIQKGAKTPLQKVLKGRKTLEGLYLGSGIFTLESSRGKNTYEIKEGPFEIEVHKGEIMQWEAANHTLVTYELCWPRWTPDRFLDLN